MATTKPDLEGLEASYLSELDALRRRGREFAERNKRIAPGLGLQEGQNQDPHVERLLEGFAFLTARIQRKLDDEYEELVDSLLEVLYPHLLVPTPSMAVVEAQLDLEQSVPTRGKQIARETSFRSRAVNGEPLRFRSGAATTLWPIEIAAARVESPDESVRRLHPRARKVLRLTLVARGEHPFGVLEIETLRLFLKGEPALAWQLYETILTGLLDVLVALPGAEGRSPPELLRLGPKAVQPFGFEEEQALLPRARRTFSGYRLLQEYFAFPAKFRFLELSGLECLRGRKAPRLDLLLVLDRPVPQLGEAVDASHFSLGCIPLANLFQTSMDPIALTPGVMEYDLVPDRKRPLDFEVHSIPEDGVLGVSSLKGGKTTYAPAFSSHHLPRPAPSPVFWHLRRRASSVAGDAGLEASLAFVDSALRPEVPPDEKLEVRAWCTNRDLPHRLGGWGREDDFQPEQVTGVRAVRCLEGPTPARRPELGGRAHWKLLSQLALNHLSLVREGKDALQSLLAVHAHGTAGREEIDGILDVRSQTVVRRVHGVLGSGLCRGLRTTLLLDRNHFGGASPLLFAAVLERFFARAAAVNSYSELVLESAPDGERVYQWEPRAGEKILL